MNATTSQSLRYGSVCSGIEAVSLAWQPLGLMPAWFSEIDPFPMSVLAHHYPAVPNLGDMTQIAPQILDGAVAAPDILVGGTPCQSFSVAGRRQGLADPRGALTLNYTELANVIDQTRQDNKQPPAIIVWENVPGVLSDRSNGFGCFLGALAGEGRELQPAGPRWSHAGCVYGPQRNIAWRVLDAQYFGVAQRRKRVFVVASARADLDPASVLFESGGVHGDPTPRGQTWQISAAYSVGGPPGPGGFANCLSPSNGPVSAPVCFGGGNTQGPIERAACLTARGHKSDFDVETFAVQSVAGSISHALNTANGCGEDGTGRGVPIIASRSVSVSTDVVAFAQNNRGEVRLESGHGQVTGTLMSQGKPGYGMPAVASVSIRGREHGATAELGENLSPALRASGGGGDKGHVLAPSYEAHFRYEPAPPPGNGPPDWSMWRVRRLMPLECERLQGLPDDYTLVTYRGKPAADSPRYKAIGNSMAVPCIAWLGDRLLRALA